MTYKFKTVLEEVIGDALPRVVTSMELDMKQLVGEYNKFGGSEVLCRAKEKAIKVNAYQTKGKNSVIVTLYFDFEDRTQLKLTL